MLSIDFEYDGQYLSYYGFIICNFNPSNSATEIDAGSKIIFEKTPRNSGKQFGLAGTKYEECIVANFDICKNPDICDHDKMEISDDEFREIMRWLNRREFLKLRFIDDVSDGIERDTCYYNASFNVSKIKINERIYGIRLYMETDKPFGYGEEQIVSLTFLNSNSVQIIRDISDEIGYTYPTVIININADGNFSLNNEQENCTTYIKNCKAGEVITLHGDTQIITSSYQSHNICNDFNYDFFRIGNTINNRDNKISASLPCDIIIKYNPIIKSTP